MSTIVIVLERKQRCAVKEISFSKCNLSFALTKIDNSPYLIPFMYLDHPSLYYSTHFNHVLQTPMNVNFEFLKIVLKIFDHSILLVSFRIVLS